VVLVGGVERVGLGKGLIVVHGLETTRGVRADGQRLLAGGRHHLGGDGQGLLELGAQITGLGTG